jgi:hypothetical protein
MPGKRRTSASDAGGPDDFPQVFAALREVLEPYASRLNVARDNPGDFCLETRGPGPRKVPLMFAAVKTNRSYVSFHFMPIYMRTMELSPALAKRMQGKACFNFTALEPALFDELRALTSQGYEGWRQMKWVD